MSTDLQLETTRGGSVRLRDLRGQVAVLFYEARGHTEANEALKQACGRLVESGDLRGRLEVLGVADLEGLGFGPVKSVVRRAVRAAAERYGTELLLDFDGGLKKAPWTLPGGGAHVAIVGADGEVAYRASGPLDGAEVERFFDALSSALTRAGAPYPTAA
jgi:hypothetical protein